MAQLSFAPDYPGAIVFGADETNVYPFPSYTNHPRAFVLHTPEEPADNWPSTPTFFSKPNRQASTTYFAAWPGATYQMVPENHAAIANGLVGLPRPPWSTPGISLNAETLSVEIEGYAATIQDTLVRGGPQWVSLVALIRNRCQAYGIPLDRTHIIGHYEVANNRSDPGALFPWDALMEDLQQEEGDMTAQQLADLLGEGSPEAVVGRWAAMRAMVPMNEIVAAAMQMFFENDPQRKRELAARAKDLIDLYSQ